MLAVLCFRMLAVNFVPVLLGVLFLFDRLGWGTSPVLVSLFDVNRFPPLIVCWQKGFISLVTLPGGARFEGSMSPSREEAAESAASMAMLCLVSCFLFPQLFSIQTSVLAMSSFSSIGSWSSNSIRMCLCVCVEWTDKWICQHSAHFKFSLYTHTHSFSYTHTFTHTLSHTHIWGTWTDGG